MNKTENIDTMNKNNELIEKVTIIREANNRLWMGLVKLAMSGHPKETKILLNRITKNDKKIIECIGELADE